MVGVFDSGMGGRFALAELRRLCGRVDIAFLSDEKNAPYGNKSESELEALVMHDIKTLRLMGAREILVACCTASTVCQRLSLPLREGVVPIIRPVARRALGTSKNGRIGVISTEATRRSGAFQKAIPGALCYSVPELVTMAEHGARDGNLTADEKNKIRKMLSPFFDSGIDTLVLGCTHFAYFEGEIENILGVKTVNSARVGAEEFARIICDEGNGMIRHACVT